MFIELLVVGVILSFLYGSGYLQFSSGYAIVISISIALLASIVGFVTTHFIARSIVDRMFGFSSWNPKARPLKKQGLGAAELQRLQGLSEPELDKLLRGQSRDVELSRQVSEIFLQRGLLDRFVEERQRAIHAGLLTREQVCAVYNRLADIRLKQGRIEDAIQFLQELIVTYPGTVEATNAEHRCALISDRAPLEVSEQSA